MVPAYVSLLIAFIIIFAGEWSFFASYIFGGTIEPNYSFDHLNLTLIIVSFILIAAFIYMLYKSIRRMLGLFFATVIAIDSKKGPQECLEASEKITTNNYFFLIKILFIATVFSMIVFNLLYFIDIQNLEVMSFSQKIMDINTYLAILIINITTTYSLNITGLAYKKLK